MPTQRSQLTDRAIRIIAENKLRAAIEAGEFDGLPGFGRPAAIFDEPYDPYWWIRRKLKREQVVLQLGGGKTNHRGHGEPREETKEH